MYTIQIIIIAIALGIDAFSVSVAGGSYFVKATARQKFRLSFHFGLFQFLMPVAGWLAGSGFVRYIETYDHWIAFGLLVLVGGKMIKDGLSGGAENFKKDISKGVMLVSLSVATSIDALAVGFSFGILKNDIIFPSLIIGIVAAAMSIIGIRIGEKLSGVFKTKHIASFAGLILILLAFEIVLDHLKMI